ncbi:hypothetical protein KEN51_CDS0367 [Pseudomonas phage vB_Pae10145-KEN51]|nr:hypothetical protein [Pseudomonas phage ANB1]
MNTATDLASRSSHSTCDKHSGLRRIISRILDIGYSPYHYCILVI